MLQLKTVLCPIDFSTLAQQELALAVEVCEVFGAQLVLHHNLNSMTPGLSRAWEWKELHRGEQMPTATAEEKLLALLAGLPPGVKAEATMSSGPVGAVLRELATQLSADLIVLGSHGWSTEDHASVSERIIDTCRSAVLTVQEGTGLAERFRLRSSGSEPILVVVPTDFTDASLEAVEYAFGLAQSLPLELHLLHIAAAGSGYLELEEAQRQLSSLVPAGLAERALCLVRTGDVIEQIALYNQRIEPAFMVMGVHARGLLRHFFTRDTARQVLHRAGCPVWFVPPSR